MKTIRLYHPHTHEGVAFNPPPEGLELTVNDADAALLDAWGLTTPPPTIPETSTLSITDTGTLLPPRHDRRARVALPVDAEPSTAAEEIT